MVTSNKSFLIIFKSVLLFDLQPFKEPGELLARNGYRFLHFPSYPLEMAIVHSFIQKPESGAIVIQALKLIPVPVTEDIQRM